MVLAPRPFSHELTRLGPSSSAPSYGLERKFCPKIPLSAKLAQISYRLKLGAKDQPFGLGPMAGCPGVGCPCTRELSLSCQQSDGFGVGP